MTELLLAVLCFETAAFGGLLAWHCHHHGRLLRAIGSLLRSQCNDLQGTHNMTAKCRQHLADILEFCMAIKTIKEGK
jgi:hypothetical protein